VVLESPLDSPVDVLFSDARARLVPAHLLVRDRFDATLPATALRIPSLWLAPEPGVKSSTGKVDDPAGYDRVSSSKKLVWFRGVPDPEQQRANACSRWLDDLPTSTIPAHH
jgi:hypothetical protein